MPSFDGLCRECGMPYTTRVGNSRLIIYLADHTANKILIRLSSCGHEQTRLLDPAEVIGYLKRGFPFSVAILPDDAALDGKIRHESDESIIREGVKAIDRGLKQLDGTEASD